MKKLILFFAVFLISFSATSQNLIFTESFDQPSGPDSVSVVSTLGPNLTPTLWNDTNLIYTTPGQSFHLKGSGNWVAFETDTFSIGQNNGNIFLSFDQIAEVYKLNRCKIQVKVSSTFWLTLFSSDYFGSAVNYSTGKLYFNSESNPKWSQNTVPDSSWWKHEVFDLTAYKQYSPIKIRFIGELDQIDTSISDYHNGWFVDNIKIFETNCDFIKPQISISNSPSGPLCNQTTLDGPFENPTSFNENRWFKVTDNHSVDSVRVIEMVNNTKYTTKLSSPISNHYSYNFSGYNMGDTIQWVVEAYDSCGNVSYFPSSGFYTFYFAPIISNCFGGGCNTGHHLIDKLPWVLDFEEWAKATSAYSRGIMPPNQSFDINPSLNSGTYFGWTVGSGNTSTSNTGPSKDHTTGTSSSKYLYSEFQGQSSQSSTFFTLPCIDLRDTNNYALNFYYHMYGADIKNLRVQIDSSKTSNYTWHNAKIITGEQQSSQYESWQKAQINLFDYKGKVIRVRFIAAINNNSNTNKANIAIDDISIQPISKYDISLTSFYSPTQLACFGYNNVPVTVGYKSLGAILPGKIPMAYQLDNTSIIYDTLAPQNITINQEAWFTFDSTMTYSPLIPHTLKVWSTVNNSSDTIITNLPVSNVLAIDSFPHMLDFESSTILPGYYLLNSAFWKLNTDPNRNKWTIEKALFNDEIEGILDAPGKNHQCLVYRNGYTNSFDGYAQLESQCINLSSLTNPVLQFQYSTTDSSCLSVLIKEVGTSEWIDISPAFSVQSAKSSMIGTEVSLAAYTGTNVQIMFRARKTPSISSLAFIDNIIIRDKPSRDLEIRKVSSISIMEGATSIPTINVEYSNWNTAGSVTFPVNLRVALYNDCNSGNFTNGVSTTINALSQSGMNGTLTFNNIVFLSPIPAGNYTAKVWINTSGDQFAANDTFYTPLVSLPTVNLPYFNDFENCQTNVFSSGKMRQWEIATPSKSVIDSAYSGNYCAVTNADNDCLNLQNYNNLELPYFDGIDTLYDVEIRFWHKYNFGSNNKNFGAITLSSPTSSNNLTTPSINSGKNWNSSIATVTDPIFTHGFTGSSNGWMQSSYYLRNISTAGPHQLKFTTPANQVEGWAIDDFEIFVPKQNSAQPSNISAGKRGFKQGLNNISVEIKNTASAPLHSATVNIETNGNLLTSESINFGTPLLKGQKATVKLTNQIHLDTTMTNLLIYTQRPNQRVDELPEDDTLIVPIAIQSNIDSLPICFNFEARPSFAAYNIATNSIDTNWILGDPTKAIIDSAFGGENAWYTSKGLYPILINSYLYSPLLNIEGNKCYQLSFWHQYETEHNFDGGYIEFSLDTGNTWQVMGGYNPTDSLWYNTQYIQSLDQYQPGWSGSSNGWIRAEHTFKTFADASLRLRFRFASNGNISGEGWAIDDVCIEAKPGSCQVIDVTEVDDISDIKLFPNPANTVINLSAPIKGTQLISIYDSKGRKILSNTYGVQEHSIVKIDITSLPKGIYWLEVTTEKNAIRKKFIKS